MELEQFRYGGGNLAYVLHTGGEAAAIDGGAVKDIITFLKKHGLELKYVLNTHGHSDHTPGNRRLLTQSDAFFKDCGELASEGELFLGGEKIGIFPAPGHSADSIVFSYGSVLITGDTLFNGTVGNCYTGDYRRYFESLQKILAYPEETRIYAGHDLVRYAMGVAKKMEPENKAIDAFLNKYDEDHVSSTLGEELNHNPFIRYNDPRLDEVRNETGMPLDTEFDRWRAMMSLH
jgi:hydroxyacylglutathione hydrolase